MNGTTALLRFVGCGNGTQEPPPIANLVVYKDDAGYGMKVSGDNPVYVQSVKEGGAAARAGLHAGDKIIKVNGVNVMQSTHTEVVQLIKSSTQVVLTVQQKPVNSTLPSLQVIPNQLPKPANLSAGTNVMSSSPQPTTSLHRAATAPAGTAPCTARITGPQPVDHEKKRQLETQRVHTIQLMLEQEQNYVDKLRSELAKSGTGNTSSSSSSSSSGSNNLTNLQSELAGAERRVRTLQEQLTAITTNDQLCSLVTNASFSSGHYSNTGSSSGGLDVPPPVPSRKSVSMHSLCPPPLPPRPPPPSPASNTHNIVQLDVEKQLVNHLTPPTTSHGIPNSLSQGTNLDSSITSINKHQRTKSSPDQLGSTLISPLEASKLLIASESMGDISPPRQTRLSGIDLDDPVHITPPGTPPPPYPTPCPESDTSSSTLNDSLTESLSVVSSRQTLNDNNFGMPPIQQPIISMEDDDMSDQEVGQLEDHGPFKSLSRLWEHHAHLSVFINYVLSNSDPSSLLFYLLTDLYKLGNAKEMKKWAYEIHSSFLVPGAPLRLNNVDENVAREIDDVLLKESDKEEILRNIFRKARTKAKEELNEQLADFQQKRTAGLGMLFGPSDAQLDESESDKSKESKIIETYLLPKMDPYLEDMEKDQLDSRQFTIAIGLTTILTKIFQVRPVSLERIPTFVAKDKSNIKARLLMGKNRKMTVRGHHFGANQYFTVTYCNHCQLIIGGIGPQGYQCSDCSLNVHRQCVRIVEENCPGPVVRKERGNDRISKLIERIRQEKKPPSLHHHHHYHGQNQMHLIERTKRSEEEAILTDGENGEHRGGISGNLRSNIERGRISAYSDHPDSMDHPSSREDISEMVQQHISSKPKTSNINRSESYKERIHHKRQLREKRKTSDPNLSKTNDCEPTGAFPGNSAGSSSNSSLSTRSLDSPSTSLEQVQLGNASTSWDSDIDVEPDPPDWRQGVSEDVQSRLVDSEKKRQEVINELFHTERSHVRALKVLSYVFHKPLLESQVLPFDQIQLLFSNLDEMVTIHSRFNQAMKKKKKENPCVGDVGELILEMFDGENGEAFERAASIYCAKQQVALEALRERRRKDPKLNSFLNEIEANPLCRRLQLKDHILTGMLRLTKYPLLFENLAKYTSDNNEKEKTAVLRALERSKEILSLVNQAVREAEDCQRLIEILRMIDRSAFDKVDHPIVQEFKNLDITKRTLIYEGPLQWRIVNRPKPVDLHVVLLDDTILLLHRQDEKYLLKFINTNQVNSILSPIVKVSTVLVRNNAVDKNSLYLVNTSQKGAQIYDLVASSPEERKLWCKHISAAAEAYHKTRNREGRRSSPTTVLTEESSTGQDIPINVDNTNNTADKDNLVENEPEATEKVKESVDKTLTNPPPAPPLPTQIENENENPTDVIPSANSSTAAAAAVSPSTLPPPPPPTTDEENAKDIKENAKSENKNKNPSAIASSVDHEQNKSNIGESMRLITCTQCSLIDPVEVHAEIRPVHIAEPVLTPIESLKRKDDLIKQALIEKQLLVAEILNIPKEDFEHVVDIASEISELDKEPAELILAAINQANQLMGMLNSALTVSETEAVLATRGSSTPLNCESLGCPVPKSYSHPHQPVIPVLDLQPITHLLTAQLSQLLKIVKEREEEREWLKKECRSNRERLHTVEFQRHQISNQLSANVNPTEVTDNVSTDVLDSSRDLNVAGATKEPDNLNVDNDESKNLNATKMMEDGVG